MYLDGVPTYTGFIVIQAEEVGFEPTVGCPTLVFKTSALGRSATPPGHLTA